MGITERFHKRNPYEDAVKRKKAPSNAYHNHFEGYREYYVMNSDGRGKHIERVYTAEYYCRDVSDQMNNWLKVIYAALFIISVAVIVWAMTRAVLINYTIYVAVPQALVLALAIINLYPMLFYVIAPRDMTVSDYKNITKLKILNRIMLGCSSLLMIAGIVYLIINGLDDGKTTLLCVLCYVISLLAVMSICIIESKMKYNSKVNPKRQDYSGNEID